LAAEMLAHQGWDSLTVDLQHGASDFASMCAMFAAISTTDTVPLMRVAWNAPGDFRFALHLDNVFDQAYADRADFAFGNYRYFPARGRALFLSGEFKRH